MGALDHDPEGRGTGAVFPGCVSRTATASHWWPLSPVCQSAHLDTYCQGQVPTRALRVITKVSNEINFTHFLFLLLVCLLTKVEHFEVQVWPTLSFVTTLVQS